MRSFFQKATVSYCGESPPSNQSTVNSGTCGADGDNLTWGLTADGEMVISGLGTMADYTNSSSAPWDSCRNSIKTVIIGEGVTSIGKRAFNGCSSLTSVTIPESVTSIPDNVKEIGFSAFQNCTGLVSMTLGKGVSTIDTYAFLNCYKLVEVYNRSKFQIVKGAASIGTLGEYVLNVYSPESGMSKLKTTEDGYVFYLSGDAVYLVGYTGSETVLTLPTDFTYNGRGYSIYKYAFYGCSNITSVTVGGVVVGDYAFRGCSSLRSVIIPARVVSVSGYAFYDCSLLTSVTVLSKTAEIYDSESTISDTAVIYGYTGSTAEAYATKYGRTFVALD